MKIARLFGGLAALCALAVAGAVVVVDRPARSFDLQGSPATVANPAADITDTYFFPSPTNSNNVVAVMDVYPLIPAGSGLSTFFSQKVLYTMKFDNKYAQESSTTTGARPVEDVVIQFSFGAPTNGQQEVYVYGPTAPVQVGSNTKLVQSGTPTAAGFINRPFTATSTYYGTTTFSVFAGARRDPSFFNASQFWQIFPDRNQGSTAPSCLPGGSDTCPNGFTAPGTDYQGNSNVLSIAVEIPKSTLIANNSGIVAYWATTSSTTGK